MRTLKSLKIRMYRGILGDCFLLRATVDEAGADVTRSILIDCGVLQNVAAGADMIKDLDDEVVAAVGKERLAQVEAGPSRISAIARNVIEEVNGRIDLLVITHEHYDHLSGFLFERERFFHNDFVIGQLWMAWTENPKDEQAKALRERFAKGKRALAAAVALAQTEAGKTNARLQNVASLAAFAGPLPQAGMAIGGSLGTADILQMLKDKAGSDATSFLEPGQAIELADFGLNAYVLGPPRDETLLRKDTPSHGSGKEVYLTRLDAAEAAESAARAQLGLKGEGDAVPFSSVYARPIPKEPTDKGREVKDLYYNEKEHWRRIENEWTSSIEALALKMDSDTNNTSLALAFELPDGQVLLFPGDAQVGNWLSWNNQSYPTPADANSNLKSATAEDLLRRVTFYKAGHHGSHNSTLKQLGLERMKDPRLVAAIPVVEAVAAVQGKGRTKPGKGWQMPFGELYKTLNEKTKGRIMQGDGDPETERQAFIDNPTGDIPVVIEHDDLFAELTFAFA
ncbi:MBL fold metallo-hydrolase [Mesorhizobium sp. M0571]|uniref:MBL fold metallo-hydrolase n=1 Tax=Mesorhizobium sp. M0571 TaxID=2956960 RepID=UPI0033392720